MKRIPISAAALGALGTASFAFGVYLSSKGCSARCFEQTIGYVFVAWGVVAFLSLLPNALGFGCMLASLALGTFLGLVFLFAGRWQGVFPPLILAGTAFFERSNVLAFYLRREARAELIR